LKALYYYICLGIIALGAACLFLFGSEHSNEFFPDDKVLIDTYQETGKEDSSECSVTLKEDGSIDFQYHLSPNLEEPFAGNNYQPAKGDFFDFSKYDDIVINLTSSRSELIPITFTLDYEGFTDSTALTNVPYFHLLKYDGNQSSYIIPISEFEIPGWWLRHHKLKESDFPKPELNRVNFFVIGSCQAIGPGGKDIINIKSIGAKENKSFLKTTIAIVASLLVVTVLILGLVHSKKKVEVNYKPTVLEDSQQAQLSEIDKYIYDHYSNPELSLELLAKEVGMSSREVSKQIKETYQQSIKEYLNTIRITEVKRLLKETNEPISEIAYAVGYNNISHFNRVFKQYTDQSPKQFREEIESA
jgi:AraC-like DNA-binding protein